MLLSLPGILLAHNVIYHELLGGVKIHFLCPIYLLYFMPTHSNVN